MDRKPLSTPPIPPCPFFLTKTGSRLLSLNSSAGKTLSTTTYALIASVQLLALFVLWTPSGIIWWQASGLSFWFICLAYASAWILLGKATFDAGIEVQSGALGWMSKASNITAKYPPMPTRGLFSLIRHPIYLAFALTLWTVPTWTPDQLLLATVLTVYCLAAPLMKERRLRQRHGEAFTHYAQKTPYMLPSLTKKETP